MKNLMAKLLIETMRKSWTQLVALVELILLFLPFVLFAELVLKLS